MRIAFSTLTALGLALSAAPALAQTAAQDTPLGAEAAPADAREAAPEILRKWVDARAGTGEPVHWVSEGGIYEYPSGKKLAGMIGFDSSRAIWPDTSGEPVTHLTRKTYAYTHPDTGEILTTWKGRPVEPIAYPYQLITYRYDEGESESGGGSRIYADVEQGTGDAVRKMKSTEGMQARMMGNTLAVTAAVFLDFSLPGGGTYEAWENYDFFIQPEGSVEEPHQMSWQRYGAPPPFLAPDMEDGGKVIYHLLNHRVESHDEFDPKLLAWARQNRPQWLAPPADIAEIRALQEEAEGTGWAR
ncbi:MAG: hypothetical protein WA954_09875 [Parerythrobacter sp.]